MPRPRLVVASLGIATALVACLSGGGSGYRDEDPTTRPPDLPLDEGGFTRSDADIGDPFAIEGLSPSHGPFTGGTRARIAGRGFSSKLRVFLGDVEVPRESFLASDPTRAAVVTPPHPPGFVDVRIRDEVTAKERVLKNGFLYDAFVVRPDTGVTSGGTRIHIEGSETAWTAGTKVSIAGIDCKEVTVLSATRIECLTPAHTPGVKDVAVTTPDNVSIHVRDAFTYSDTTDGYRGGLSGGALSKNGTLRVLAFNAYTGAALPGAYAIVGGDLRTAKVNRIGATGVTEFTGLTEPKVTVTVAAECHQPITFVDVDVDTVTTYLSPVFDLSCVDLTQMKDPPSTGSRGGRYGGVIQGELRFPGAGEFAKAGWTTVPAPTRPSERRAAYVFEAVATPSATFQLPSASEAVTPDSPGGGGYTYSLVTFPGNVTIYAVAGLEDRSESPPRFIPYAMGVARGISVAPQTRVEGVDMRMDVLFDHQVTIATQPPARSERGPDRLSASVAVTLGAAGYAIFPRGTRVVALPTTENIAFVGVPALDNALAGEQYVLGAAAGTGPDLLLPASVIGRIRTTNANTPVTIGGFLGVPILESPGEGVWSGDRVTFGGAEGQADLTVVQISSGSGLMQWTMVAPGAKKDFAVPNLSQLPSNDKPLGLMRGGITTTVYVARIDAFAYGTLRYGQMNQGAWNAHAVDARNGAY